MSRILNMTKAEEESSEATKVLHGAIRGRYSILRGVSSWLKLLALIVLCAEAILLFAILKGQSSDPGREWYVPMMLLFLSFIVAGLFVDRFLQTRIIAPKEASRQQTPSLICCPKTGRQMRLVLAERIAVVSETLRNETFDKICHLLATKIRAHRKIFEYPNPSILIPIDDRYFGRFSWDEHTITCHEVFEIPRDVDQQKWNYWCTLQQLYVEAFCSEHRQEKPHFSKEEFDQASELLKHLHVVATKMVALHLEEKHDVFLCLKRFKELLDRLCESEGPERTVKFELALSAAHDLVKRLMPRVVHL